MLWKGAVKKSTKEKNYRINPGKITISHDFAGKIFEKRRFFYRPLLRLSINETTKMQLFHKLLTQCVHHIDVIISKAESIFVVKHIFVFSSVIWDLL